MSQKVNITLDDEVLAFVDRRASDRSIFINRVLQEEKKRVFRQELAEVYRERSDDLEFLEEMALWDVTAGDGLNALTD